MLRVHQSHLCGCRSVVYFSGYLLHGFLEIRTARYKQVQVRARTRAGVCDLPLRLFRCFASGTSVHGRNSCYNSNSYHFEQLKEHCALSVRGELVNDIRVIKLA